MKKHIKQTHHESIIEQLIHTGMGMVTTFIFLFLFFDEMPVLTMGTAAVLMTVFKFVMHYNIRRYFTSKKRGDKK